MNNKSSYIFFINFTYFSGVELLKGKTLDDIKDSDVVSFFRFLSIYRTLMIFYYGNSVQFNKKIMVKDILKPCLIFKIYRDYLRS